MATPIHLDVSSGMEIARAMTKSALYAEGAQLPAQLARLLFLADVVRGRRVLEIGARSHAVASLLLHLGASRVVCASDDRDFVDDARAARLHERIDHRTIRGASLPADDGAFDLVIDFGLPDALRRGETQRLSEIARLLSPRGFAITALRTDDVHGLDVLLEPHETPARALDDATAGPVAYRALVELLQLRFDLVQVYFQSLLLGFLFGSFDVEARDDGIAPDTALMGDEPEPAGAYLFAFGHEIPVIDDVSLVQIPFDALLAAHVDARDVSGMKRADALPSSVPSGAGAFAQGRTHEPAAPGTAAQWSDRTVEVDVVDRAAAERTRLLAERDALAARVVESDGELQAMRLQLRGLVEARDFAAMRVQELEDALVSLDGQRGALQTELHRVQTEREGERQRARVELEMADAALQTHKEQLDEIEAALVAARERMVAEKRAAQEANEHAARVRAEEATGAIDEAAAAAARVVALEQQFATQLAQRLEEQRAEHAQHLRAAHEHARVVDEELQRARVDATSAQARVVELEADAVRLADGVKALVAERDVVDGLREQLAAARRELDHERARAAERTASSAAATAQATADATAALQAALHDAGRAVEELERKQRVLQQALEDARRETLDVRARLLDVAAQRDAVQQTVMARDHELRVLREDLRAAVSEGQRLAQVTVEHDKRAADEAQRARELHDELQAARAAARRRDEELARLALPPAAPSAAPAPVAPAAASSTSVRDDDVMPPPSAARAGAAAPTNDDAVARERASHEATRDELAATTEMLLRYEEQMAHGQRTLDDTRARLRDADEHVADVTAKVAELAHAAGAEQTRARLLAAQLEEAQEALVVERARADLFAAQLHEARAVHARARQEPTRRPGTP